MFRFKLSINEAMLTRWRELPERAQRNMKRKLREELVPELQTFVDEFMREGPPLSAPFTFNTEASKRYWFYLLDAGLVESDGSHYERTGQIETGWRVMLSSRFRAEMVTIQNIQFSRADPSGGFRNAAYVYGPRYVFGHVATGWVDQADHLRRSVQERFVVGAQRLWRESVREAKRGQG